MNARELTINFGFREFMVFGVERLVGISCAFWEILRELILSRQEKWGNLQFEIN